MGEPAHEEHGAETAPPPQRKPEPAVPPSWGPRASTVVGVALLLVLAGLLLAIAAAVFWW